MSKKIITLLLFWIELFCGCASYWEITEDNRIKLPGRHETSLKKRWMVFEEKNCVNLSRHAPNLDLIMISRNKIGDAFKSTALPSDTSIELFDIAENVVSNLIASQRVFNVEILKSEMAQLDNNDAFRLLLQFSVTGGVKKKAVVYGFLEKKWYYEIVFSAGSRYYFDNSFQEFEQFIKNFKGR